MRKLLLLAAAAVVAVAGYLGINTIGTTEAGKTEGGPWLSHDVYFSLKDPSPEAKKKLVDSCKKHLSKHEGEIFFGAGLLAEDLKREVNDIDYDVALHIVFRDKAAHDAYQTAPRHKQFIDEGKADWKKVRVFDSYVSR